MSVAAETVVGPGPLGLLPRLSRLQVRLEKWSARAGDGRGLPYACAWLSDWVGADALSGPLEVLWRPSGLRRPGLVAQLSWPRLATRLALGIENPIAHAVVDRMLGFDRLAPERRLQLSPVEWGVLTFVLARTLERLAETDGPLGPWDLTLDRVGPDPFDSSGLGEVITLRWTARVGEATGSVRLWLPETLVRRWLSAVPSSLPECPTSCRARHAALTGEWRAEAGTIALPRGLGRLRVGGVLPMTDAPLRGTPQSPRGPVALTLDACDRGGRFWFPTEPAAHSGGGRLKLAGPLIHQPTPREAITVNPPPENAAGPADVAPNDVPVTLTVELGRVNLSLQRLADLRPGDVIELGRHSREPVELTSGGRLVARGELVQIDTELGVRVTHVFL